MPTKLRVLIVDDSVVFRSQIRAALETSPDIEIAGIANNGKIALQKLAQASVDVVVLDMEMPEMGGMETIKEIRRLKFPTRILVFSSATKRGSVEALEALTHGADDLIAKPDATGIGVGAPGATLKEILVPKVLQFQSTMNPSSTKVTMTTVTEARPKANKKEVRGFIPEVIVIASSTGGPAAIDAVLALVKNPISVPIVIAQHMPPVFTASMARRIQERTGVETAEAEDKQELKKNRIYIAPGNFHLSIRRFGPTPHLILGQEPLRNSVRPAADYLFESAARTFGNKCLGVVLTGMGEDGLVGCRAVKESGGAIVIQNKESCTVFGMPGAVFQNDLQDQIQDLNQLSKSFELWSRGQSI